MSDSRADRERNKRIKTAHQTNGAAPGASSTALDLGSSTAGTPPSAPTLNNAASFNRSSNHRDVVVTEGASSSNGRMNATVNGRDLDEEHRSNDNANGAVSSNGTVNAAGQINGSDAPKDIVKLNTRNPKALSTSAKR